MGDGVSRRRFLAWSGAAAGASVVGGGAVAATSTAPGRRWLHSLGLLVDQDTPIPSVDVAVTSGRLPSGRRWLIARTGSAAGGGASVPVPSIACLHGRNNDERFAFDVIGVARFAAAASLDVVVGSLDGGPSSYWHRRRDPAVGDPMADLVDGLVPLLDERSGGGPRSVLGWSMGGYGALLAAQQHPSVFSRVAAASPAVWRRARDAAAGAFDGPQDFAAHDVFGGMSRMRAPARIDCGSDDPFEAVSEELLTLAPLGSQGGIWPGFHDAKFWRTLVDLQLAFLTKPDP